MLFADVLEDVGEFAMNWYVWVPCSGLFTVLLVAGVVVVLVVSHSQGRRRRDDD